MARSKNLVQFNKIFQINSLPKPDSSIVDDDMSMSGDDTAEDLEDDDEASATIFNEVDRPRHKHHDSSVSSSRVIGRSHTNSTVQQASFNNNYQDNSSLILGKN